MEMANKFLLGEVMKKLQSNIYDEQPCSLFKCWQGLVFLSFPLKRFYKITSAGNARFIYLLFTILGFLPLIPFVGEFLGIYGLGCLMFVSPLCILNDEGIEEKDKWMDLKRYLEDFSNMEQNTIEMVKIWQFYLTYSIALGIESISSEEIETFFGNNIYNYFEDSKQDTRLDNSEIKIIEEVKGDYKKVLQKEIDEEIEKSYMGLK